MHRTLLLGLFLLASLLSASAQPILTSAGDFKIGQQVSYQSASPTSVSPGPAGPDVVWDFTGLVADGTNLTLRIVSPEETSHVWLFPDADLVEYYSTGIFHYQRIGEINDMTGFVDESQGLRIGYPNPWRIAKRPFAYGEHLYDTLTQAYNSDGLELSGIGFSDLVADGYGVLKLPDGTERMVIRTLIDLISYDTSSLGILTVHFKSWRWFEPDGIFPVLRIDSQTIASDFFNATSTSVIYGGQATTGVNDRSLPMKGFRLQGDGSSIRLSGPFVTSAEYLLEAYTVRGGRIGSWSLQDVSSGIVEVEMEFEPHEAISLFRLVERKDGRKGEQSFIVVR